MPKVTRVESARKARPESGIRVGDSYYWWQFMRGPRMNSKTPPRPSQLTRSEFMVPYLQALEALGDLNDSGDLREDLAPALRIIVDDLESLRDETQDKLDNMPESLQQGDTGQLLEERVANLEQFIPELERLTDQAEGEDWGDTDPADLLEEAQGADPGIS